eukprot:scaffold20151_cov16-Tisochrysis_lutea.AAC.2
MRANTPLGSSRGLRRSSTVGLHRLALSMSTQPPLTMARASTPSTHSKRPATAREDSSARRAPRPDNCALAASTCASSRPFCAAKTQAVLDCLLKENSHNGVQVLHARTPLPLLHPPTSAETPTQLHPCAHSHTSTTFKNTRMA